MGRVGEGRLWEGLGGEEGRETLIRLWKQSKINKKKKRKMRKNPNFSSSLPTVGVMISLFVCVHPEWLKSQPLTNLEMGPPQTPEPQVLWSWSFWSPELWEISSWGLGGAWTAADVTDAQWTKIVFIIRLMDWFSQPFSEVWSHIVL